MSGSFLGPKYDDKKIENDLKHLGANYKKFKNEMLRYTAKKISEGKAVGWFHEEWSLVQGLLYDP